MEFSEEEGRGWNCLSPTNFVPFCGSDLRSWPGSLQEAAGACQRPIDGGFRVAVSLPSFLGANFIP